MSWLDRLTKASWRGMEFLTESHEAKFGRRLVVHEFPGADLPLIEDLGAKAADLNLSAYFIGADYDFERNKFLFLLNKVGADWLDHPWLGHIEVRVRDFSLTESTDKGGYCVVNINFVPAGIVITEPKEDKTDDAVNKSSSLADTAQGSIMMAVMSVEVALGFIDQAKVLFSQFQSVLSFCGLSYEFTTPINLSIQTIVDDFESIIASPTDYVAALRETIDGILAIDNGLLDSDRPRIVSHLTNLATRYPIQPSLVKTNTVSQDFLLSANIAKNKALQSLFLTSVAGQLALADYHTIEQRDAVLTNVLHTIDVLLPALPDDVFQAAVSMRVAVYDAMIAQNVPHTQQRDIFSAMPSIALAHKFELDDDVFIEMNAVRHPLFVEGKVNGY